MTINPEHEPTGDQTGEAASPLPATTYEQAQATYRCTSDARERFEELDNRDLSARAIATLQARGTYDPQQHGDADKYPPLTAEEHLEVLAAGELLARHYRAPRAGALCGPGRCVVVAGRGCNRLRRGDSPAGLPGVGRRPAPPARRLRKQIRP